MTVGLDSARPASCCRGPLPRRGRLLELRAVDNGDVLQVRQRVRPAVRARQRHGLGNQRRQVGEEPLDLAPDPAAVRGISSRGASAPGNIGGNVEVECRSGGGWSASWWAVRAAGIADRPPIGWAPACLRDRRRSARPCLRGVAPSASFTAGTPGAAGAAGHAGIAGGRFTVATVAIYV